MRNRRNRRRSVLIPGILLCLAPAVLGAALIINANRIGPSGAQIGIALVGGAVVSAVLFAGESVRDARFVEATMRHTVATQIALTTDLSGADLRGQDLRGLTLRRKNLRNANLEGVRLDNVDLSGADLRGAVLRRANLSGANLVAADLRLADARQAKLFDATGVRMDARGCTFAGADMRGFKGHWSDCGALTSREVAELVSTSDVSAAAWNDTVPTEHLEPFSRLRRTSLSGVNAVKSVWSGTRFTEANLSGADFSYSRFGAGRHSKDIIDQVGGFRFLWMALTRDKRATFVSDMYFGAGHPPPGPATFVGANLDDADMTECLGPGLDLSNAQLLQCRAPVAATELRPSGRRLVSDDGRPRSYRHGSDHSPPS